MEHIHAQCCETTEIDGTRVICRKSRGHVISLVAGKREHYDSDKEVRWAPSPFTAAQKEALAFHVSCPRCQSQEHFRCRKPSVKLTHLVRPHPERVETALETLKENG